MIEEGHCSILCWRGNGSGNFAIARYSVASGYEIQWGLETSQVCQLLIHVTTEITVCPLGENQHASA